MDESWITPSGLSDWSPPSGPTVTYCCHFLSDAHVTFSKHCTCTAKEEDWLQLNPGHSYLYRSSSPKEQRTVVNPKTTRRRSSQGTGGGSKSNKPYVIPTGSKSKSVDSHGYTNPLEWNSMNSQRPEEETINLPMQPDHQLLCKTSSEPGHHEIQLAEKEKRQITRTMTQPCGTITYTVSSSDTLMSLAARFDTTPSELCKLNRLVSRHVFPGQVLYVPDKAIPLVEDAAPTDGGTQTPAKQEETCQAPQSSPKPGHVERVQSPPSSPLPNTLVEEDEKILDKECIERFLKINVRHITDGQGVVCGVLLVTPNAVMFDPNVSDPLVIEHGAEKYGVMAPMEFVVNAAMYNDIATMFVSHAPNRSLSSPPEVYHSEECPLARQTSGATLSGRPSRSDSEMGVNGSVSDMAEAGTPEEERGSLCSCQTPSAAQPDIIHTPDTPTGHLDSVFLDEQPSETEVAPTELPASSEPCVTVSEVVDTVSEVAEKTPESKDVLQRSDSQRSEDKVSLETLPPKKEGRSSSDSCCMTHTDVSALHDAVPEQIAESTSKDSPITTTPNTSQECSETRNVPSDVPPTQQPQSAAAAAPTEQVGVLKESLSRKNTPSTSLEGKMKVLKRLSYPLSWMESFSGTEKDKENSPPLSSLPEGPIAQQAAHGGGAAAATPPPQQSTFSKLLASSPRSLVDFSSGLFNKPCEDASGVKPQEGQTVNGLSLSLLSTNATNPQENTIAGNSVFYDQQRLVMARKSESGTSSTSSKKRSPTAEKRSPSVDDIKEPKVGFKSVVSVDDMPDLFASIDQLIPRPAKPCDDPPLYLCLRMGKRLNKKILKSTPMMAYGKKRMKREYWFSIPRDRVDDLYSFFHHWAPNVYGDLDEEAIVKRGFELVLEEEVISDDEQKERNDSTDGGTIRCSIGDEGTGDAHSDWEVIKAPHMKLFGRLRRDTRSYDTEVVSVAELKHQMSIEVELPLPDLIGLTTILEEEHRKMLVKHLPARAVGYAWTLIFSSSQHGFSLKSLYRKMAQYETPVLLVIMDTENNVFGALTSCSLRLSDHFYGTGESFLFTFFPEFKVFNWTGENMYFIKGNNESLAIGAGDGVFGLWLDGDLYHGRNHPCKTYNNDILSSKEDFYVKTLEAWGFVEVDTAGM